MFKYPKRRKIGVKRPTGHRSGLAINIYSSTCGFDFRVDFFFRTFLVWTLYILTYGCEAIHISSSSFRKLSKESCLNLSWDSNTFGRCHECATHRENCLLLLAVLRSCILHSSNATHFYAYLLTNPALYSLKTLVNRCASMLIL